MVREGQGDDEFPAWSPDDRRIALAHIERGERRIAVIASTGGPLSFVSDAGVFARDPAWSPDGSAIAYVDRAATSRLLVAPARGGPNRVLATSRGRLARPSWAPDARYLAVAFQTEDGQWGIGVVSVNGGPLRPVIARALAPLWLPDGRLVFLREGRPGALELWRTAVAADGTPLPGTETQLTRLSRGQSIEGEMGVSTDGRYFYFGLEQIARADIWLAEAP
jgi:TolB protein